MADYGCAVPENLTISPTCPIPHGKRWSRRASRGAKPFLKTFQGLQICGGHGRIAMPSSWGGVLVAYAPDASPPRLAWFVTVLVTAALRHPLKNGILRRAGTSSAIGNNKAIGFSPRCAFRVRDVHLVSPRVSRDAPRSSSRHIRCAARLERHDTDASPAPARNRVLFRFTRRGEAKCHDGRWIDDSPVPCRI